MSRDSWHLNYVNAKPFTYGSENVDSLEWIIWNASPLKRTTIQTKEEKERKKIRKDRARDDPAMCLIGRYKYETNQKVNKELYL